MLLIKLLSFNLIDYRCKDTFTIKNNQTFLHLFFSLYVLL